MTDLQVCPHGFHHPKHEVDVDYPHSCDGCWCEGWRDRAYGWNHDTTPRDDKVRGPQHSERACEYCGEALGRLWLNTGNGPHHKDCWIERTTPGNREEA